MLDFVNNLPNKSNNPYATLKQEVYNKCFENTTRVDYNYFVCITNRVLTLDSQYQASHITRTQSHPHCTKCNGLGHTTEQHVDNHSCNQSSTITPGKPPPKNGDRGPPNRAYVAEEEKTSEVDESVGDEALFADFEDTQCTDLFLNNDNMFDWYAGAVIEPNHESSTLFLDALQEESYATML
ncbi:hypothetical protein EDD85DRAFT_790595 [Armillaria nabsnona]|nr:hypothetical protein EDD85DRAFT_790595 [Armillaria nabsnona]